MRWSAGMSLDRSGLAGQAAFLSKRYRELDAPAMVHQVLRGAFAGRTALVSSFGADSAVMLHLVAEVDRETPVLFLETGFHFPETLAYRDALVRTLGLRHVRSVGPDPGNVAEEDPRGDLHRIAPRACCALRKTRPLQDALAPYCAWLTGRRRDQSESRADLAPVEHDGQGRLKFNPLIDWSAEDLKAYRDAAGLPAHPLVVEGYPSIGCAPCTSTVGADEDQRAGRWRGTGQEECGIHIVDGGLRRGSGQHANRQGEAT